MKLAAEVIRRVFDVLFVEGFMLIRWCTPVDPGREALPTESPPPTVIH